MGRIKRTQSQTMMLGCGLLVLILLLVLTGLLFITANRERHALRFPGSTQVPSLTTTQARPTYIRLDNGYRSQAPLGEIGNWYARTFQLTVLEESDVCMSLEGVSKGLALQRRTTVTVCDASAAREIWISRLISQR